ncbi:MAG TPA: acyl-CoA thioesterase domain-containing protein, partial [Solirubrobacterales bacterium]
MDAFYEPDGDGYLATELTRGPWDPGAQHAGPPAALLGRALELLPEAADFQICRITFEILRSIPIGPVEVDARIVRPGRRVQLLEGELRAGGEVLMM